MRKLLIAGLVLIPVMWFGVPTITNARPLVSAELAELSVRRIEGNKFIGVFHRYTALTYLPIQLLALLSVVCGVLPPQPNGARARRRRGPVDAR